MNFQVNFRADFFLLNRGPGGRARKLCVGSYVNARKDENTGRIGGGRGREEMLLPTFDSDLGEQEDRLIGRTSRGLSPPEQDRMHLQWG